MRFLRFNGKSHSRQRVINDKFCLVSSLSNFFIEKSQKVHMPGFYITNAEQILQCKARCRFIQYMPNKPIKFGKSFGWQLMGRKNRCSIAFHISEKIRGAILL